MVDVRVGGIDIEDATGIYFSDPGITAKTKAGPFDLDPTEFTVSISTNVQPGVYEARVVGRYGASNPRRFIVGQLTEIMDAPDQSGSLDGQKVPLNCTINGQSRPNAFSKFRFETKQGQRIMIDAIARDIDSRMEPSLLLQDARGREVARDRTTGHLDFVAREDGEMLLKLSDLLYKGGGVYFYRLNISTTPHLDFILPRAAGAGTSGQFTLYGRNLPGSEPAPEFSTKERTLEKLTVKLEAPVQKSGTGSGLGLPAELVEDGFGYQFQGTNGTSNPLLINFASGPVVLQASASRTNPIAAPAEFHGQFYPGGEPRWCYFTASKGQMLWVEIFAQRLGYPVAPFGLLQKVAMNPDGSEKPSDIKELQAVDTNVGGIDFNTATRDGAWRFEVPEDATYRVGFKDLFHPVQADPRFGFRVIIRPEKPDFSLAITAQAAPLVNKDKKEATLWTPVIRPGETIPIRVIAFRKDGFNDEIELTVTNLPPGLTCPAVKVEAGNQTAHLLIRAATNVAAWTGPLKVAGRARVKEQWITHQARSASLAWQVEDYTKEAPISRLTTDMLLSVVPVEASPVVLTLSELKEWRTKADGKIQVPVAISRQEGFTAALKLRLASAVSDGKEVEVDGKATNAVVELDVKAAKLAEGTHYLRLIGVSNGKYRKITGSETKVMDDKLLFANQQVDAANKEKSALSDKKKKAEETLEAAKKRATEAKPKAESEAKAGSTAASTAASTEAAKTEAEKALREIEAGLKEVEARASQAASRVKALTEKKNHTRDITYTACAGPITLVVEGK